MYHQTDKKSAIKEIQTYLYVLSDRKYKEIPRVPIDGIFDKESEAAVIEFQKIKLFSETGIVDYETFTALYEDYLAVTEDLSTNNYIFGDSVFPISENDQNEDVRALHVMINELRKTYPQITDVGSGAYFSKRTGDAIEDLRTLFMLPKSRKLDKALYQRMTDEIESRKRLEEKYE